MICQILTSYECCPEFRISSYSRKVCHASGKIGEIFDNNWFDVFGNIWRCLLSRFLRPSFWIPNAISRFLMFQCFVALTLTFVLVLILAKDTIRFEKHVKQRQYFNVTNDYSLLTFFQVLAWRRDYVKVGNGLENKYRQMKHLFSF